MLIYNYKNIYINTNLGGSMEAVITIFGKSFTVNGDTMMKAKGVAAKLYQDTVDSSIPIAVLVGVARQRKVDDKRVKYK